MAYTMAAPEEAEWYITDGIKTFHVAGGDYERAEGVTLATTEMGSGVEDMIEAPFEAIYTSTAFQLGGTYGGMREKMFQFSLTFHVFATSENPWRITYSRFRKMFGNGKKDVEIHCKIPGVSHRWLRVRLQTTSKLISVTGKDPNFARYGRVVLHFVGAFPRWIEDDWTWTYTTTLDTRTTGVENATVRVANQTNCEQWIKWVCQAGNAGIVYTLPDFSWGDDRWDRAEEDEDRMLVMPPLTLGEHIVVDTDEFTMAGQVVSSLDTEVYLRMNSREFMYPLPAYTDPVDIPIQITKADIGNVIQVRVPRTWTHPFGME